MLEFPHPCGRPAFIHPAAQATAGLGSLGPVRLSPKCTRRALQSSPKYFCAERADAPSRAARGLATTSRRCWAPLPSNRTPVSVLTTLAHVESRGPRPTCVLGSFKFWNQRLWSGGKALGAGARLPGRPPERSGSLGSAPPAGNARVGGFGGVIFLRVRAGPLCAAPEMQSEDAEQVPTATQTSPQHLGREATGARGSRSPGSVCWVVSRGPGALVRPPGRSGRRVLWFSVLPATAEVWGAQAVTGACAFLLRVRRGTDSDPLALQRWAFPAPAGMLEGSACWSVLA